MPSNEKKRSNFLVLSGTLDRSQRHLAAGLGEALWCLQALLANISAMYAVYHGPEGLQTIADRVHGLAAVLAAGVFMHLSLVFPSPKLLDSLLHLYK